MTTELVQVQPSVPATRTPNDLLAIAVESNADIDKLEKLMELQQRWERREAEKAYYRAMSAFKANPPEIYKDATVDFSTAKGRTHYRHATLASAVDKIGKALSEHGLSVSWRTNQAEKISVTCTIAHELGHSESTTLSADPDMSGNKNSIQAIGSTVSYLQRYTLFALTGLASRDQDDDGRVAEVEYINEAVANQIADRLAAVDADTGKFLEYIGAESFDKILKSDQGKALNAVMAKEKQVKK